MSAPLNFSTSIISGAVGKSPIDFPIWNQGDFIKACEWAAAPAFNNLKFQLYLALAALVVVLFMVVWREREGLKRVFKGFKKGKGDDGLESEEITPSTEGEKGTVEGQGASV